MHLGDPAACTDISHIGKHVGILVVDVHHIFAVARRYGRDEVHAGEIIGHVFFVFLEILIVKNLPHIVAVHACAKVGHVSGTNGIRHAVEHSILIPGNDIPVLKAADDVGIGTANALDVFAELIVELTHILHKELVRLTEIYHRTTIRVTIVGRFVHVAGKIAGICHEAIPLRHSDGLSIAVLILICICLVRAELKS